MERAGLSEEGVERSGGDGGGGSGGSKWRTVWMEEREEREGREGLGVEFRGWIVGGSEGDARGRYGGG